MVKKSYLDNVSNRIRWMAKRAVACHPSFLHKLHSFNPYAFAIQYFSPNIICLT